MPGRAGPSGALGAVKQFRPIDEEDEEAAVPREQSGEPPEAPIAVAIMAKAPRAGEVKTRLCPPLAAEEAAALYRCFLLDKIDQVGALTGASAVIAYTPPEGRRMFEELAPGFILIPQRGRDLGERLANSVGQLLSDGHRGALLLDSDTPTLPGQYLDQALALLMSPRTDVVLGPSEDGGYYLIGLRRLHRELFEGMVWSTPTVLRETVHRAEVKGLTVALLPPWFDIDTAEDLDRLRASLRGTEGPVPRHTRRFFTSRARR